MTETPEAMRSPEAVARRCVVLLAVVGAGHGVDRGALRDWLHAEGLWDDVSPREASLLTGESMTKQESVNATWRVEALQPLAWALGLVDEVGSPNGLCDVARLQQAIPELGASTAAFVGGARLRSDEVILEANEVAYQQHWEARDARLNGKETAIDIGVIQERHLGLNWLIGYEGQPWDEVRTDT